MSTIADIADAVVEGLNGHTFSQTFTAARAYLPVFDLKEMKDLHVTVVPKGIEMSLANRTQGQDDVQMDVAVQKKVASDADTDGLMSLVEEIANFIRQTRVFGPAVWVRSENVPIYSPEHLGELRQFTSVLTLTLRILA